MKYPVSTKVGGHWLNKDVFKFLRVFSYAQKPHRLKFTRRLSAMMLLDYLYQTDTIKKLINQETMAATYSIEPIQVNIQDDNIDQCIGMLVWDYGPSKSEIVTIESNGFMQNMEQPTEMLIRLEVNFYGVSYCLPIDPKDLKFSSWFYNAKMFWYGTCMVVLDNLLNNLPNKGAKEFGEILNTLSNPSRKSIISEHTKTIGPTEEYYIKFLELLKGRQHRALPVLLREQWESYCNEDFDIGADNET